MRRARMMSVGWDADLAVDSTDDPGAPGGDHVLIEVGACGVCFRDCIDRSGRFPFIQTPVTPGHEAAGVVVAVGPDVTEWKVGDRVATMHRDHCGQCDACRVGETSMCQGAAWVFGLMVDGGYATHLVAPERAFYRVPDGLPAAEAAVLHCTYGTAYRGLNKFGELGASSKVLITGANGGVGHAAVQIARRQGAEVTAIVRSEAHVAFVESCGADRVIVDDGSSFHRKVGRVDVVLDCVGQPTFNASLRSVRLGGGITVVGNVVPDKAEVNLGYLIVNGIWMAGSSGATRSDMEKLVALHARAPMDFRFHARMSLDEADAAQRMVQSGGLEGRIVLEM